MRRDGDGSSTSTSRCAARSGTYIRAIARDLGAALGVGGHLTALRRTAVGPFDLDEAHTLDELAERLRRCCRSPTSPGACFPRTTWTTTQATRRPARPRARSTVVGEPGPVAVFDPDGEFLALYEQGGERRAPRRGVRLSQRGTMTASVGASEQGADPVQIWRSLDEVPADLGRTVVTIGNFDGVHLGHQHVRAPGAREVADRPRADASSR